MAERVIVIVKAYDLVGREALTLATSSRATAYKFSQISRPLRKNADNAKRAWLQTARDPADRIIIAATARELGATLIARDRKLLDYGGQGHVSVVEC